jgi:hypothetical protein
LADEQSKYAPVEIKDQKHMKKLKSLWAVSLRPGHFSGFHFCELRKFYNLGLH